MLFPEVMKEGFHTMFGHTDELLQPLGQYIWTRVQVKISLCNFHSSIFCRCLCCAALQGLLGPLPVVLGRMQASTQHKPPVYHLCYMEGQTALVRTLLGNLKVPVCLMCMSLNCGRKQEYPGRIHTSAGRTRKNAAG